MFSLTAEYALRAMACLALTPDQLVPTTALARQTKVPPNYLAKVLQLLAASELISGRRGVGGGYRLARNTDQITLMEILRAVTQIERITACPLGIPSHGTNLCPLHRKIDEAAAAVIEIYGRSTLADLLNDPSRPRPLCESTDEVAAVTINGAAIRKPPAGS